jgi:hypothetical protein
MSSRPPCTTPTIRGVAPNREREILERSIRATADRARDAYDLIQEIHAAGFPVDGPTNATGRCTGFRAWEPEPGHWAHAEPAPPDHPPVLKPRKGLAGP